MGTFLGAQIIRIIVFLGLYWGSPYSGKLQFQCRGNLPSMYGVGFGRYKKGFGLAKHPG